MVGLDAVLARAEDRGPFDEDFMARDRPVERGDDEVPCVVARNVVAVVDVKDSWSHFHMPPMLRGPPMAPTEGVGMPDNTEKEEEVFRKKTPKKN